MAKKKIKKLYFHDFVSVIEEARKRLPNADERLAITDAPMCLSHDILRGPIVEINGKIWLELPPYSKDKEIYSEYWEEINLIAEILQKFDSATLSKFQKDVLPLHPNSHRQICAQRLWNWYGIPWRFRDGYVYLIGANNECGLAPPIHSFSVEDFLSLAAGKFMTEFKRKESLHKQLNIWMVLGLWGLLAIFVIICKAIRATNGFWEVVSLIVILGLLTWYTVKVIRDLNQKYKHE